MISNESVAFDENTSGDHTAVAAGREGQRVAVIAFHLANGAGSAQSVKFKSGTATDLTGVVSLPSSVGGAASSSAGGDSTGLFFTKAGEALTVTLGAATQVAGFISYRYVQG